MDILITIFSLIILLFSIMLHEIAHGNIAYHLGDPTAKYAGRLTLNPLKHLDPFGSIILPLILLLVTFCRGPIFGWAKPVPINPYNFKDQKWGTLKVAIAGPSMNFLVAIIFGLLIRFFPFLPEGFLVIFSLITVYNLAWGIFNLVPIPPLDGSHILFTFLPEKFTQLKLALQQYGMFILLFFIFFGLTWIFQGSVFLFELISGQPLIF